MRHLPAPAARLVGHARKFGAVLREEGVRSAILRSARFAALTLAGRRRVGWAEAGPLARGRRFPRAAIWARTDPPGTAGAGRRVVVWGDFSSPQCREYRGEAWADIGEALGLEVSVFGGDEREAALDALQFADWLVLYRLPRTDALSEAVYEARRLGAGVLYDIDDPLFSARAMSLSLDVAGAPTTVRDGALSGAALFAEAMNLADGVIVATETLADLARCLTRRPVVVRRNFVRSARRGLAAEPNRGHGLVLPSGSRLTGHDRAVVVPTLATLLGERPDLSVTWLGPEKPGDLPEGVEARSVFHPFEDYEAHVATLSRHAVVLVPLADTPINRAKSAVRFLDATLAGVPVVASPIGEYADLGDAVALASTSEEWTARVNAILDDREAARRAVSMARQRLAERSDVAGVGFAGKAVAPLFGGSVRT